METYIYAQLDENNVCVAVSQLNSEFDEPNMIRLDGLEYDKLGQKYEDGQWHEVVEELPPDPETDDQPEEQSE